MKHKNKLYKMTIKPKIGEMYFNLKDNSKRIVKKIDGDLIFLSENISFYWNVPSCYIKAYE